MTLVARLQRVGLGLAVCGLAACDGATAGAARTPTAPSAAPVSVSGPTATVSGRVLVHEAGGVAPLARSAVSAWLQTDRAGNPIGSATDANGLFTLVVPLGAQLRLRALADGRYQPCTVTLDVRTDVTQDVHVITDVRQLGASLPAAMLASTPLLSGVVFEQASGEQRPVEGALVELDGVGGMGFPVALTRTDADGRFVCCGLGADTSTYLFASKAGYRLAERAVPLGGGNVTLEIELQR